MYNCVNIIVCDPSIGQCLVNGDLGDVQCQRELPLENRECGSLDGDSAYRL